MYVSFNNSNQHTVTARQVIDEDECKRLKFGPRQQEHLRSLDYFAQDVKAEVQKLKTLKCPVGASDFYEELENKRGLYE